MGNGSGLNDSLLFAVVDIGKAESDRRELSVLKKKFHKLKRIRLFSLTAPENLLPGALDLPEENILTLGKLADLIQQTLPHLFKGTFALKIKSYLTILKAEKLKFFK